MSSTASARYLGVALALGAAGSALAGFSSVVNNDKVSACLQMFGDNGTITCINSLQDVAVMRGAAPVSIGENLNAPLVAGQRGKVLFQWDEVVGGGATNLVVAIFKTSDGEDLFPAGVVRNSEPFNAWTWNLGAIDAVTWRNNAATAPLYEAKVQFSSDLGQTFFATTSLTANMSSAWNGRDTGLTESVAGTGLNYIRLIYSIGPVPAPGTLGVLFLCTTAAVRRRTR